MFTRRQALMGAAGTMAVAAAVAGLPTTSHATPTVRATEAEIAALPRQQVSLVAPPFVHAH